MLCTQCGKSLDGAKVTGYVGGAWLHAVTTCSCGSRVRHDCVMDSEELRQEQADFSAVRDLLDRRGWHWISEVAKELS